MRRATSAPCTHAWFRGSSWIPRSRITPASVTFGNGLVVRELIISIDDQRRRLAWTAVGGRTTHYNAVLEVLAEGAASRAVWVIDLLPDEMAEPVGTMQAKGLAAMKATFERRA